MATWFGRPPGSSAADTYQAQLLAQQAQLLAQQQYHQAQLTAAQGVYMPSHTHTITTAHTNPYAQATGIQYPGGYATVTSTGMGTIYTQPAMPGGMVWAQPVNSYYVELPKDPCEGDEIVVYYKNGRWLEKKNFIFEEKSTPRGGFSLKEIEEAERIMEELAA